MKAADKAYEAAREEILMGRFGPGARITENEIAKAAAVSRTPVREALRRLEAEGLIQFVPNQGAFVRQLSMNEARHIFELRARLESYAARLAAENADERQARELSRLAEQQLHVSETRRRGYLRRVAELNERFHELLLAAARSEPLRSAMAPLTHAPLVFQTFRDYGNEDLVRSARHHIEIAQAIGNRDGDWAASVMRAHLYAARDVYRRQREKTE